MNLCIFYYFLPYILQVFQSSLLWLNAISQFLFKKLTHVLTFPPYLCIYYLAVYATILPSVVAFELLVITQVLYGLQYTNSSAFFSMSHATSESFHSVLFVHGTEIGNSTGFYIGIRKKEIYMNKSIDYGDHLFLLKGFHVPSVLSSNSGLPIRMWRVWW